MRAAKEVRNDATTDAAPKVGTPKEGDLFLAPGLGAGDGDDSYEVVLTKGRRYAFATERSTGYCGGGNASSTCFDLELRNPDGKIVASAGGSPSSSAGHIDSFRAPAAGTYLLAVSPGPFALRFTLTATQLNT